MYRVHELLADKQRRSVGEMMCIAMDKTVDQAARIMSESLIGSLVVCDESGSLVGIITERGIVKRVVAEGRDPAQTLVRDVMTTKVLTCIPETRLEEARKVMREQRVRHLPVLEKERPIGMVSIGDLNIAEAETLVETIRSFETYIAGRSRGGP